MTPTETPDRKQDPAAARRWDLIAKVVAGVGVILVAALLVMFTKLRPIADDYCFAAKSGPGVLDGIRFWFDEWMGDITSNTLNTVIVGFPVVHFPWSLASWVSRLAVVIGLVLVSILLARSASSLPSRSLGWTTSILVGTVSVVSWWTYWWTRTTLLPIPFDADISEDSPAPTLLKALYEISALWITHSSNINAQYVFAICLGLSIVVLASQAIPSRPIMSAALFVVAGVVIGFSGPVVAVSYIIAATMVVIWMAVRKTLTTAVVASYLAFVLPLIGAVVISNQSPGTRQRQAMMLSNPDYTSITPSEALADPVSLLTWTFPRAVIEWGSAFASIGTVAVFALAIPIGYLIRKINTTLHTATLLQRGLQLLGVSLVISIVNRASEAFSYVGIWHQIYATTILFLAITLIGLAIGQWLADRQVSKGASILIGALALTGLAFLTVSAMAITTSVWDRSEAWEVGPAPLPRIPDIESLQGCWSELGTYRGLPNRSS